MSLAVSQSVCRQVTQVSRVAIRVPLIAFLAVCLLSSTSLADNIDEALLKHAPDIIKRISDRGYRHVGILTFMLQRGNDPSSFHGGLICSNMPERVSYSLALRMNSQSPEFVLLRGAADVAHDSVAKASYRTKASREKLFAINYPVLWGTEKDARPDVLLAGKVKVGADLRTTKVVIGAIDRDSVYDLLDFEVPTDRSVLADIGEGFSLSKHNRKFLRGFADDAALDVVSAEQECADGGENTVVEGQQESAEFPVKMTVYYDGVPQELSSDPEAASSNSFVVSEPSEGQEITIGVRNETDEVVGIVLTVNGVSTLDEERGDPKNSHMRKWVIDPHKDYRVKGFHQPDGKTYFTIRALSEAQSRERFDDLGGEEYAGLIHLHVFRPVDTALAGTPPFTRSLGRLSNNELQKTTFRSLRDVQLGLAGKSVLLPGRTRPLFGWGVEESEQLRQEKLPDVRHTATMVVRYYKRPE